MTAEPSEAVKRAARAIYETEHYGGKYGGQYTTPSEWDIDATTEYATAALLTTREPSEEEISAGRDALANFEISDWRTASSPAKWADMARACLIAAGRVRTAE